MNIEYNYEKDEYYIKEKIDNQTFYMAFQQWVNKDTIYYNVYMTLYTKRKHIDKNESAVLITGKNPFKTVVTARKAFNTLERNVVRYNSSFGLKTCIYTTWLDTKRKNAYYKVLHKKGYRYTQHPEYNKLCIMKIFNNEDDII